MSKVWKKVKRNGYQASKYAYKISLQELIIETERKPEKVQIAVMHGDDTMQSQASGPVVRIPFDIPLLSGDNGKTTVDFGDGLDEKEISVKPSTPLVSEEALNVPEANDAAVKNDEHRRHSKNDESPLPILPDDTMQSQASIPVVKIPFDIPLLSGDNGKTTVDFGDSMDEKEISVKSPSPLVNKEALKGPEANDAAVKNDEHRRHSKTDESPLPIRPHRFSFFGQSDSLEHDIDPYVSGQHHPNPPQHLPAEECTTSDNFALMPSTSKHDESILAWCQRVTAEYIGGAKANDPDPDESELNVTLTRKIVTDLEEKKNSEDEQKYVIEHMKLLNEKDALVRKQDYFNVAAEMSEVEEKLGIVQQRVNEVTTMNDADKTEEEKQRIDDLVEEYKSLIDKKNELAEILIQKEAEEEEHDKFGRQTLERSQNFLRGSQEPLNTSRRIMNWIKSTTS
uniref:BMERB domain-containing protein n=1 Tax=Panagrolaimus sp. ES5 TaxID=591445 RepID=A0AC34FV43_9BILA